MGVLLILAGIVVLAFAAHLLFQWADKYRVRRRAEADEYTIVHGLMTAAIRQAHDSKAIDAKLLTARLIGVDPPNDTQEATAAQAAVTAFLDSCEVLISDIKIAIEYDHKHFKKLTVGHRAKVALQHETWHTAVGSMKQLAIQLEDLRKQYIH